VSAGETTGQSPVIFCGCGGSTYWVNSHGQSIFRCNECGEWVATLSEVSS
jgi:tRNA(Ile2) C34 agmatinyltransferase TiaS